MIYLDNSATTRQADEVTDLMADVAKNTFGNPSSLYSLGMDAEKVVENARKTFAKTIGADSSEIFFNSGGTEGDNTVLREVADARKHQGKHIIVSSVEHPAVLENCDRLEHEGYRVSRISVDSLCHINMEELADTIDEETTLISVMAVNNEVGTIMPIKDIVKLARKKAGKPDKASGILVHTDAVQGYGKVDLKNTGVDFLTVSAHKFHGPKGVGAMYVKKGTLIPALILGGGQERGYRSGTENVPGIAGLGKAAELMQQDMERGHSTMKACRTRLLDAFSDQIDDIIINSPLDDTGADSVLNISFLGVRGEVLLHVLEEDGIYVSTGSACSSNHKGQSHVLQAMGRTPKDIEGAVRFSFSRYNRPEDMDIVADRVKTAVQRFRRLGSFQ
jgi:cysteine desulfurase